MTITVDPRPKVLLTGFGPFPGVAKNASRRLVISLASRARWAMPSYRFVAAVLPTEWVLAPRTLADLYDRHEPVLALHFGVASEERGFRIETEARNSCQALQDATGCLPPAPRLVGDGADTRAVAINASSVAACLNTKGYTVSLSNDAGGYLCNAVLYHSLLQAERRGGVCRVGFVHIPANLAKEPLTLLTTVVAGALEILKLALEPARVPLR